MLFPCLQSDVRLEWITRKNLLQKGTSDAYKRADQHFTLAPRMLSPQQLGEVIPFSDWAKVPEVKPQFRLRKFRSRFPGPPLKCIFQNLDKKSDLWIKYGKVRGRT